ncbi:MAG TPA: ABC transporter ATP-binding protein, partial [Planctomycetota bacterium]|nr:ABC transporter ATP-binding protein [Planctomycetota bacterium]
MAPVLSVRGLRVRFELRGGVVRAVDGVDLELERGETLGIVGESGSGKSVTSLALMGLVATPPGVVEAESLRLGELDLATLPPRRMRALRGKRISMIFQDPMTSLNPLLTVERQLSEVLEVHRVAKGREARTRCVKALADVGIPNPEARLAAYPHELSGGMRQRVMIAMALLCDPEVLIADEPTTALDVTIQAQILELMRELQRRRGTAIVLITHDLGVVAGTAHRVQVMYAGRVVESGSTQSLFERPLHPYTRGLLASIPTLTGRPAARLESIEGQPPDLALLPPGCAFAPRCGIVQPRCREQA